MSKSLPVCPIWSGFLAQLPPFSCVEFTVTGLLNLWSDCATHSTVTVWGDGLPPPADRHVQVLYPSLLTRLCLALILRAALFFSHSEEVTEAFQEIHIDTWPSDSDVVILITVNVINILFFKHPLWMLLSRLPKILGIPSGEFWTERSCHRNKQERFFRQTLDAMETTMCTLGALRLTDTAGPDSCVSS